MIAYHLMTDPGERGNNEDNIGMYQAGSSYCFVLADGLGGHGKGEVASGTAVEQTIMTFAAENGDTSEDCISKAMRNAEKKILEVQRSDRSCFDMKTTCVTLFIGEEEIRWAHVGDSRLYYFQNGKIVRRTLDHSVPQMLVASGQIREKDIRRHPDRNRLLRVMGIEWEDDRFQVAEAVERGGKQAFLLCSDGFWELIEEKKMEACLKHAKDPEDWVMKMKEIVLKNGKGTDMDNYSAVAVILN